MIPNYLKLAASISDDSLVHEMFHRQLPNRRDLSDDHRQDLNDLIERQHHLNHNNTAYLLVSLKLGLLGWEGAETSLQRDVRTTMQLVKIRDMQESPEWKLRNTTRDIFFKFGNQ